MGTEPRYQLQSLEGGKSILSARRSDFAQAYFELDGKPFRLKNREYLLPIYNNHYKKILLMCGRQVEKSTTISTRSHVDLLSIPFLNAIYFTPTMLQTRTFSTEKLRPLHKSKIVNRFFVGKDTTDAVFEKSFKNGSNLFLRYVFLHADRMRGIPGDELFGDEIQDILPQNIAIAEECLSHDEEGGPEKFILYSGTPKTEDNTIEMQWQESTQNEWMVPCTCTVSSTKEGSAKNFWNNLDRKNVGKQGPICSKCHKPIDVTSGKWIAHNIKGLFPAFRISQLMVPWKLREEKWYDDVYMKMVNRSEETFENENVGRSTGKSSRPITSEKLKLCCHPANVLHNIATEHYTMIPPASLGVITAGLDYGEGRDRVENAKKSAVSYTVFTAGVTLHDGRFWVFYQKRYQGREADPEFIKKDVVRLCRQLKVAYLGADWGHGFGMNSYFRDQLGSKRVIVYYYSWNQKVAISDDGEKLILNRNMAVEEFIDDMNKRYYIFPCWEDFKPFGADATHVYPEFTYGRICTMLFTHNPLQPDDALHSMIYARITGKIAAGVVRPILQPGIVDERMDY